MVTNDGPSETQDPLMVEQERKGTISPQQMIIARKGLAMSLEVLSKISQVSDGTLFKFERGLKVGEKILKVIRATLEAGGVTFLEDGAEGEARVIWTDTGEPVEPAGAFRKGKFLKTAKQEQAA